MVIKDNTIVASLTVAQYREMMMSIMDMSIMDNGNATVQNSGRRYEYGLRGFAKVFGCSIPTAQRLKSSGKFDAAIKQIGRKIVVDADLALEIAGEKNKQ